MISIIELILERIVTKTKDVYADGTQHAVYQNLKDPSKIFKVVKPDHSDVSKQAYDWIKIFKENPNLFPKVYRSSDRGAEVEKLDANKAKKDYTDVMLALKEKSRQWDLTELLKDIAENETNYKATVNEFGEYLTKQDQRLASIFKNFVALIIKLQPINSKDYTLDIHQGNFGYDKSGKLKMIDL